MDKNVNRKIKELADKYNLNLVLLFGSQVTGKTHSESDFDVAYMSNKKLSFNDEVKLNTNLTEIFENDQVSLVNLKTASPLLTKLITDNCIVLYEREKYVFSNLLTYVLRTYEEARPLFELRRHYIEHKIRQYQNA